MGSDVDEVSRYLKMKSIIIPSNNDWLTSCVECFKEQGNRDLKQLKELVFQQWLLADLSDIGVQVLPDSCLRAEKVVLQGRYAVQLNYFVDISVSFYKQIKKLRKPETLNNLEVDCDNPSVNKEAGSGNRTLKIEVTDGVLTVIAFEDHFISSLQEPLVPGKKAILVGPLECRKGVIFLRSRNIQILGGEVDALHIPNAAENILARALKLPENPDPYHLNSRKETPQQVDHKINTNNNDDDEEAMMLLADVIENEVSPVELNCLNSERQKLNSSFSNNDVQSNFTQISSNSQLDSFNQCVNSSSNEPIYSDDFDDDVAELEQKIRCNERTQSIEFDEDFELLAEQSSHISNSSAVSGTTTGLSHYQMFDITSSKKQYAQIAEMKKKLNDSYGTNENKPSTSGSNSLFTDNSSINALGRDKIIVDFLSDKESPLTTLMHEAEISDTPDSFPSVADNNRENDFFNSDPFPPKKRPALIKTLARIVKVLKKPKLKDDKWSVSAIVAARGIELEVTFASEVIDKIFTISAAEIIAKRSELISNPVLKQKINETLKSSQLRFSTLACVMVFNFKDAISKPVIVDIE